MVEAWRIVKERYADTAFTGDGARRFGGRWNSPGQAAVYTSATRALATLEILAGLGSSTPLSSYVVIPVEFEREWIEVVELSELPPAWNQYPPGPATQQIGDQWLREMRSVVLSVPSAIVPQEQNHLLNPLHPGFRGVKIGSAQPFELDPRILP